MTEFQHGAPAQVGVLFCNLGTPDEPTPGGVRRYLREFLWDPRVVQIPRPVWWLILNGIILPLRPRKVAHAYQSIWMEEGAPLRVISMRQAAALQAAFDASHPGRVVVATAMRYGNPSIADGLKALRDAGAQQVLVLPAYPQYSSSTTASVLDKVADVLRSWPRIPELRLVRNYHNRADYIQALAASVREHWERSGRGKRLLMSFHGVPQRYLLQGDPYHCECQKTGRLLAEALGLKDDEWQLSFQSRFGAEAWLQPYTDVTLKQWARDGIDTVDVICPGFSADCLETLEEIAMQNRDVFVEAGGTALRYIPCLNERADHIAMLHGLAATHMSDWLAATPATEAERAASRERARRLGADA